MASERIIRSFDAAFEIETEMHTIGDKRLPKAISARYLCWAAFWVVVMVVLHRFPIFGGISKVVAFVCVPLVLSSICAAAKIEGRRLHVMLLSSVQHIFSGGTTTANGRALAKQGVKHKAPKLRAIKERQPRYTETTNDQRHRFAGLLLLLGMGLAPFGVGAVCHWLGAPPLAFFVALVLCGLGLIRMNRSRRDGDR